MKMLQSMKRPIVGVMGSGTEEHASLADSVGRMLANLNVHLLTGGGRGTMERTSRAFASVPARTGLVIGILPSKPDLPTCPKDGYPNEYVDLPIRTHLWLTGEQGTDPLSRNNITVLSSDALIILPGSAGTASEAQLAVRYQKPVIAFLDSPDQVPGLPATIPIVHEIDQVERFVRTALGLI